MYANRKKWNLTGLSVELAHERDHGPDCERCEEPDQVIDVIRRSIELEGDLDDAQIQRLLEIADRCPVHRSLEGAKEILTRLA
jgi:putative redox protein